MDENIFLTKPEFINMDIRKDRPEISGGNVDAENTFIKHFILLPKNQLIGKRVLDLGSCNATSGAWVLNYGADFYKGIEIQTSLVKKSINLLNKYYPSSKWDIENSEIEQFLQKNNETYDITIMSEVLHALADPISILNQIAKISKVIIIESSHPTILKDTRFLNKKLKMEILNDPDYGNFIENETFMGFGIEGMTIPENQTLLFKSLKPSLGMIKLLMHNEGFIYNDYANNNLKQILPNYYSKYNRYAAVFFKKSNISKKNSYGFKAALDGTIKSKVYKW